MTLRLSAVLASNASGRALGDLLTLEAPGSQDATLADLAFTLAGVSP